MAGDESGPSLYRDLLDRFEGLEAGHAKLREELNDLLLQEKRKNDDVDEVATTSDSGAAWSSTLPGCFNEVGPYRSVLESMGHAVHVCTASSEDIIYWYVWMPFHLFVLFLYLFIYSCFHVEFNVNSGLGSS